VRYLGLDLGTRTLGISVSDTTLTVASSIKTIRFDDSKYEELIEPLKDLIATLDISKIVLGLPKNMNNTLGPRAHTTIEFKEMLEKNFDIEVVLQDERRTTIEATNYMLQSDISRKKRKMKVDALAASIILQTYLDKEKGMK